MSPLAASGIVFASVLAGALLGLLLRSRLPKDHLSADTRDVVKLSMGILGTMTALVLGLLIASAKSSFDAQRGGVSQLAANVVLLDRTLALYGPQTNEIRSLLWDSVDNLIRQTWPDAEAPGIGGQPRTRIGPGDLSQEVYELV